MSTPAPQDTNLYIWFIDVGMGDATFIKCPPDKQNTDGFTILVDFGTTKFNVEENAAGAATYVQFFSTISTSLNSNPPFVSPNKVKQIDVLFITHPDKDHYNLLYALIDEGYSFGKIYFTGDWSSYSSGGTLQKGMQKGTSFMEWLQDQVSFGTAKQLNVLYGWQNFIKLNSGVTIHVLASNVGWGVTSPKQYMTNTASTVLMIEYGGKKVLLAADATRLTENQILSKHYPNFLKSDILKLGHHGSARTSTTKEWIEAVQPECIFISAERVGQHGGECGKKTGHRLPQQAAIDTVLQFCKKSVGDGLEHSYVAYYDIKDADYSFNTSRALNTFNHKKAEAGSVLKNQTIAGTNIPYNSYYEVKTDKMIFTSICKLDLKEGNSVADYGTTYGLIIPPSGTYEIYPWLENFNSFDHWPDKDLKFRLPDATAADDQAPQAKKTKK